MLIKKIRNSVLRYISIALSVSLFCLPNLSFASWSISAPNSVNFSSTTWNIDEQQTLVDFSTDVVVSNDESSSSGFTAQVTSTEFSHDSDITLFMPYTSLEIKTGSITTDQPTGVSALIDGVYTFFSGILSTSDAIDFMTADATTRNAGSWSITPSLRLTIPAKQKVGTYTATITFSLI